VNKLIRKYEYETLRVGEKNFEKRHWNALIELNEKHQSKYFEIVHKGVRFKQFVGIIQIGDLQIEILPKADKHGTKNDWQKVLTQMLVETGYLHDYSLEKANVNRQNLNLIHIYFELYLRQVQKLIRLGLVKKYRQKSGNLKMFKGKPEFARHIAENLIHKERFYTTHQVYDTDHLLHQILSVANKIVRRLSKGTHLSDFANRIVMDFPEVKNIWVSPDTFDKIRLNRKTFAYEQALELARLIILNYTPDIRSGQEQMLSLLFDMNELWENFVFVRLKKYLRNMPEWQIKAQVSKRFVNGYTLRPDIYLENTANGKKFIIDTKWKHGNQHIDIADLRQVYVYGKYWNAEKVMLLYPGNHRSSEYLTYENPTDYPKIKVKNGFVSILNDKHSLKTALGKEVFELVLEENLIGV